MIHKTCSINYGHLADLQKFATDLNKKNLSFDKISPRDFYFFPFFSICTCVFLSLSLIYKKNNNPRNNTHFIPCCAQQFANEFVRRITLLSDHCERIVLKHPQYRVITFIANNYVFPTALTFYFRRETLIYISFITKRSGKIKIHSFQNKRQITTYDNEVIIVHWISRYYGRSRIKSFLQTTTPLQLIKGQ